MMPTLERLRFQAHAQRPAFQRRVAEARAVISEALQVATPESRPWYLAFSGGSDSTVLLDMIRTMDIHIDVIWGDDGWDYPETLAFLHDTELAYGYTLYRVRSLGPWASWCREMGRPELAKAPDTPGVWGNPPVWDYPRGHSDIYGGVFLGLLGTRRKDGGESWVRHYQLRGGHRPLYPVQAECGVWHCSPLATWTKEDVWAYLISRNVSYNPVYDRLIALGVPLEHRRVAPLTCFRVMQFGSHAILRQGWPDMYNRLSAIFPRIGSMS